MWSRRWGEYKALAVIRRIVLLAINSKYVHSSLAVWLIAAGIREYTNIPHEVCILETTIHQPCNEIADDVAVKKPDIIGISSYIWNARILPALVNNLKCLLPQAKIVLGGPEAEYNADFWRGAGADYILTGEGETSFPELITALYLPMDVSHESLPSKSLSPSHNKKFHFFSTHRKKDLYLQTDNSSPSSTCIVPDDAYYTTLSGRIAYLETSRGCPFTCSYCLSAESSVKYFPLETVKQQICKLSQTEAKTIKLTDRTFNCNPARAYDIISFIVNLNTTARFHFEAAADLFDKRTLNLLATAPPGRIQLEIGIQSFFEPALSAVSRKTDLKKAERNIRSLLQNENIHIHIDLISGLPYETFEDIKNSFDRAYSLNAHTLQLGFLKVLHGSPLRRQAAELGITYDCTAPYEIISSTWLSSEDIKSLKQTANALQNTQNKQRFIETINYTLSTSKFRPFTFYQMLGKRVSHNGTSLSDYAAKIFYFCASLPNIKVNELRDYMTYDWLAMVKGKNKPSVLKTSGNQYKQMQNLIKQRLCHKVRRDEVGILSTGTVIYVDSSDRDPVTGLYKVHAGLENNNAT